MNALLRYRLLFALLLLLLCGGTLRAQFTIDLRAANIVQGSEPYDVFFNMMSVATFSNLGPDSVSALQKSVQLPSSPLNVRFATSAGATVVQQDVPIVTQKEYVFITYGTAAAPKLKVLERLRTLTAGNNRALVRFFNASTISGGLDFHLVSIDSPAVASSVLPDSVTPFSNQGAGPTALIITNAGSTTPLINVTLPLVSQGRMTLIVTGSGPDDIRVLAMRGEDQNGYRIPELQRDTLRGALPLLRVVHAWPQTAISGNGWQRLDIFMEGATTPTIAGLGYRYVSGVYGPFTEDTVTVRFARENEGLTSPVLTANVPMERDSLYTVILTRFTNGTAVSMTLGSPILEQIGLPGDTVHLRVAQAADGFGAVDVRVLSATGDTLINADNLTFLTATPFTAAMNGPVTIEVTRDGAETPFYTRTTTQFEIGTFGYYTILLSGEDSLFAAHVINETMLQEQELDPTAEVPVVPGIARGFQLSPNPAVGVAPRARFELLHPATVSLSLVDAAGRTVAVAGTEMRPAGTVDLTLPTDGLPSGVYNCVVTVDGSVMVKSVVVGR